MTFEQAMQRLDEIVARLSEENPPLEESLSLYAEGASLIASCNRELEQARVKLETLEIKKDGETNGL
ncbi:MAG: exodeoxyribonuclease VII small subunit [Oscillospiraceae bacterium]|nr:MAG: exodeoxyribonuclease VII small subunit [Oscillospiraceae bacterium]